MGGKKRLDGPAGRVVAVLVFLACAAAILASFRPEALRWPGEAGEDCLGPRLASIAAQREAGAISAEQAMIMRQQAARECN